MPEETTRRLAAIMMGDIAGYSRLMGADERGTHARVQLLLRELIDPTIAEHRGRVLRTRGDGFLAMFDSPVEAVRCAIVIQQSMVGRNLELPSTQWIRFRIGVNLGDVIVEPDDIYGEGVNVAATARAAGRAWQHLHLGRRVRTDPLQAGLWVSVAGRSQGQEHSRSGADLSCPAGSGGGGQGGAEP